MANHLTNEQRLYLALEKTNGTKDIQILSEFNNKWPAARIPHRNTIANVTNKLRDLKTVHNQYKGTTTKSVRNRENIEAVRQLLENEKHRSPDEPGSSIRRNPLNIKRSSFNNIVNKDLAYYPYKIAKQQKINERNAEHRLAMCRKLARKPVAYYDNLIVSDEAIFSLGGHVHNRKNNVNYSSTRKGRPNQWYTERSQGEQRVMALCFMHGSGHVFGPYWFASDKRLNADLYKHTLAHKVFPEMKTELGRRVWDAAIWQQDGAKCHQANIVVNWLDDIFEDRMLAIRSVRGDQWAPSSPDMNPCDYFLWGYLKEKVYKPMPTSLAELKGKVHEVFHNIPREIRSSILSMKSRAEKVVAVEGYAFEGRRLRF